MDPFQSTPPTEPFLQHEGSGSTNLADTGKPKGYAGFAWLGIITLVIVIIGARYVQSEAEEEGVPVADEMGELMMKLQSRLLLGSNELEEGGSGEILVQAEEMLNIGSVGQRQRFVILTSELAGPFEARNTLEILESEIANPPKGKPPLLTTDQEELQELLNKLYGNAIEDEPDEAHLARIEALSADDRQSLIRCADWFGELALVPPETKASAEREAITAPAQRIAITMIITFILVLIVGFFGFVGLVLVGVLTAVGKIKSRIELAGRYHGIYAETFALWLLCFFVLQIAVQLIVAALPAMNDHLLFISFIAFICSLALLAWPVWRGISWSEVRRDIGWTTDRLRGLEPILGIGGYVMTLPILAIGVLLLFALIALQALTTGESDTFAAAGGPAHPIINNLANGDLWTYIQVYLVASVGAPIVEETMFRGVLYQHLRSASRHMGVIVSILLSTLLNTFVFAAIHPQGWIAIPALMSLAIGFTLMREWRGTIIPSILMHGINNALVMTLLMIML